MSAASTHLRLVPAPTEPPVAALPPASAGWLWADEAANRANISEGQVRRNCPRWHTQGLARQAKRPNGQSAWQVHESADARFVRIKSVEQLDAVADLGKLTEQQRAEVMRRKAIVLDWDEARGAGIKLGLNERQITDRFLAQLAAAGTKVSRATLYNWRAEYRAKGIAGLIDSRWQAQQPATPTNDVYRETLLRVYLDPRQRSLKLAHELAVEAADRAGQTAPAYSSAKRIVAALEPAVVCRAREGKKAHEDTHSPYIERDYSTIDSNEWWTSDHHRLDIMVRTEQGELTRPWLHAWQDVRSRKIVAWRIVAHDPNADLILSAFASGVRAHGVPAHTYVDNGKDYDARQLQGVTKRQRRTGSKPGTLSPADLKRIGGAFGLLGVDTVHCWPYHGQSKPIERFFKTVKERFAKLWDTYTGGTTAEKPEDLARHIDAGHAPTLAELHDAFEHWLADDYHARAHLGDGMAGQTPDQVFAACLHRKVTLPDELLAFACMPRVGPLVIRQNGVHWNGLSWGRSADELARRYGDKVMLAVDVDDLKSVIVLDLEGRIICRASANERVAWSADKQSLREAIAEKKAIERRRKAAAADRPRATLDVPELMLDAAARKAAATRAASQNPEPPTPSIAQTPISDQLQALRDISSTPVRKAVGAESIDPETFNEAFPKPARSAPAGGDVFSDFAGAFSPRRREQ